MPTIAEVRAQYPQYSDMSDTDLAGALHAKFYADMPADQFADKIGLKPDQYKQAAIDERDDLKSKGIDTSAGLTRRVAQGATFNAADEIMAAATTPFEMFKRGTMDPREGYRYAKAREDLILDDARKNTGALGTVAEIGGGFGAGVGLARAGATFGNILSPNSNILARAGASALDGGAMGGIAGLLEGNTASERLGNAGQGALIGGAVGAAVPPLLTIGGAALSPITSNLRARANPTGFAESQVARAVSESGMTPKAAADAVAAANADGQGMFTLADALGNSGQRMLSTVTRAPGQGRTEVVDFLNARQAGQSRRVANALSEGFEAPQTAAQTEARLTAGRDAVADAEYGAVRADAKPVDLSRVIDKIDQTLAPGVTKLTSNTQIANDSIEAALDTVRKRLTDGKSNLTDFEAVQRVRGDLSDAIQAARQAGAGNKARLLKGVLQKMDSAMESASAGHRQANANFARATRDIEAVDSGRTAAMRGRTEDTIPAFQALPAEGQQAFRAGYADPLIGQAQGAAFGTNAARPLTSAAFFDEAAAMAPRAGQLQSRLTRENTMFQTRNASTGNSKTVENMADDAAMAVDPTLIGQIISGNWPGAVKSVIATGSNALTGNTPQVRQEVGRILLQRGTVAPQNIERMIDETIARIRQAQETARTVGRGAAGALAIGTSNKLSTRRK